ncbi:MAG: GDYXXLXY domain-containing protein [Victivallaceae bacterium]|nr:GDYXXLXY domain-containing protein [Victivallaceae bacterium]
MRKLQIICFLLAAAGVFGALIYRIVDCENIIRNGVEYRVRVTGYDPYDPIRGRYIAVRLVLPDYRITEAERAGFENRWFLRRAYATLTSDEDGFAKIVALSAVPPENGNWAEVSGNLEYPSKRMSMLGAEPENEEKDGGEVFFASFDTNHYYLNESLADRLEQENFQIDEDNTIATIRVLNGKHIVTGLTADGVPLAQIGLGAAE